MEKKKKNINYNTTEQTEIKKFLIVIVVVLAICGVMYFITRAFVTKDLGKKKDEEVVTPGTVNYNVAIMGQILNRGLDEYYVAIYDSTSKDYASDMVIMLNNYSTKEKALHVYRVDLSNKLNADYYDPDNVNTSAQSVAEMKVGDITLLKVKKGKISKYIVDYDKMKKELGVN